jgi:hypothetical protein
MRTGEYRTQCGNKAIVAQVKIRGRAFIVSGAIECRINKTLVIYEWNINGKALNTERTDYDLVLDDED